MSDLVDPAGFPARAADLDTGAITDAAADVRAMGRTVEDRTRAISARWAGLGAHYEAPEHGQVFAVLDPAVTSADELNTTFAAMARALDTFAAALGTIKPRLADLERRAAAFRADVVDGVQVDASSARSAGFGDYVVGAFDWVPGVEEEKVTVPWYEDGDSVARNDALVGEYDSIAADISAANAQCADDISRLVRNACVAPVEAIPAEAFAAAAGAMPWGSAREEDRNCPESVGHGAATFGGDLWDGARQMVVGYDPETGAYFEGTAYAQAWGGLGDLVGSTLLLASPVGWVAAGMSATGSTDNDFHRWMVDRADTVAGGWGSLIGYDAAAEDPWHAWKEDGVAAGTTAFLSIGTFFIPGAGQVGAGLKAGSIGARTARIAAAGADFAVQGGSWVVRGGLRVTTGLGTVLRFGDDVLPRPGQVVHGADGVGLSPTALITAVDDVPAAHVTTSTPVSDSLGLAPPRTELPDTSARPAPDPRGGEDGPAARVRDRVGVDPGATAPGGPSPAPTDARPAWRVEVPEEYAHLTLREVDGGSRGAWVSELHRPEADTVYVIDDRHMFVTDDAGRVTHVESELQYRSPEEAAEYRNGYQQRVAGREFRLELDEGGHLVGVAVGGPGEGINLVPMERSLNRQGADSWGTMEMEWIRVLRANPDASIRVAMDVDYPEGSTRPEAFYVTPSVDGVRLDERVFEQ